MGKTRPGMDRIFKQELQSLATFTERRIKKHVANCGTCSDAGTNLYGRCREWWAMAKTVHVARRELRQYDALETANMDVLPGMEDFG